MENTIIWVITTEENNIFIGIELFLGQNKYTKAGLFSGPLRRLDLMNHQTDPYISIIKSTSNVTQTGKNKFLLHKDAASDIFDFFRDKLIDSAYFRMSDKKLHYIARFIPYDGEEKKISFEFDAHTGSFYYHRNVSNLLDPIESQKIITIPKGNLFLYPDGVHIKGLLTFSYNGVEVPSNVMQEKFELSSGTIFRNLQFERHIQERLLSLGGRQSVKNEIIFPRKEFFSTILSNLVKEGIALYWGEDKKPISRSSISCNISYDIDWFSISGNVTGKNITYSLSDLLHSSKGRAFVEIDDGILFLPEELQKIALYPQKNDAVHIAPNHLAEVYEIAARFKVDPSIYLRKFLDFSQCSYTLCNRIDGSLKSYQRKGVSWILTLYQNGFGGCLADDMGLGKTIQSIAFICCQERNSSFPVLVVVPKVVLYNWKNEFSKFAPEKRVIIAYGSASLFEIREEDIIYLTTYDFLINNGHMFSSVHFDTMILDESQYIKNRRTKRYKSIKAINTNFILALTGTPIENSIEELWSLFDLLNPGILGNFKSFMRKFASSSHDSDQIAHLRKIISPFILRRTKEEVLPDLPRKEEKYIYCEMEPSQRDLYDTLLKAVQNELSQKPSKYTIKDSSMILQGLLYLREVCSDPQLLPPHLKGNAPFDSCKFDLFKELSVRVLRKTGKLIVYSLFPEVLRKMESWSNQQGWATFYIDGSTNNRQKIVEKFESLDQGIFLISLKAGGVGLNLTSCQYVFIYDPWWNIAAEQQAANRVYRIGQDKPVFIYHFLIKNTIEERIFELQQKKDELSQNILDRLDSSSKLSIEDLYQLLF